MAPEHMSAAAMTSSFGWPPGMSSPTRCTIGRMTMAPTCRGCGRGLCVNGWRLVGDDNGARPAGEDEVLGGRGCKPAGEDEVLGGRGCKPGEGGQVVAGCGVSVVCVGWDALARADPHGSCAVPTTPNHPPI
eukprot:352449-Chlamydomonas_euryale.AAC.4